MTDTTFGRLLSRWLLLLILALPPAVLWLHSEVKPDLFMSAVLKLSILIGVISGLAIGLTWSLSKQWSGRMRVLETFVAALPSAEGQLPEGGEPEVQRLTQEMRGMSQRVRRVVERANLEASRREAILACMADGVIAVDGELRVVFCNEAFAQSFGSRNPLGNNPPLYEVVREPLLRDVLSRVLVTGDAETDRFQLPTAESRWFEARALPYGNGPERGAVIVLHDVTDLQKQEQVRKDFVADVSHELRTPLSAIRGYAETLLDGALEDSEHNRKFVEVILSHAIRLNNIASDLLTLSELDNDSQRALVLESVSVADVIRSALHSVHGAAAARHVTVLAEGCENCHVMGHRFRLEQVLVNLLDNAVKFNRENGEVKVKCERVESNQLRLSVSDTGIGIPSGDLKRVFERFYRVDKARSRPAGGTGLGLPIVKQVIERLGGTVAVESQLAKGTTFTILLPLAPEYRNSTEQPAGASL